MIRAFLGIDLPADLRAALVVQQFLLPLPRKTDPLDFHLTLVFLGEVPDTALEAAHDGFQRLQSPKFTLDLQGLGLFGGERPKAAWAGLAPSDALANLQAKAEHVARAAGCPVDHRRFHPHVTLGRFPPPRGADAMGLERAIAAGSAFRAGPWPVTHLTLWQSHPHRGAPHYDVLATYPLS